MVMKMTANRWIIGLTVLVSTACDGESTPVDMSATGLDYVQRLDFEASLQAKILVGGTGRADAISIVADASSMIVHMDFFESAFDFNEGQRVGRYGALVVHEKSGDNWQRTQVITATTADDGELGRDLALADDWLFATYGSDILIFQKADGQWVLHQVLDNATGSDNCITDLAATPTRLAVSSGCRRYTLDMFALVDTRWVPVAAPPLPNISDSYTDGRCVGGPPLAMSATTLVVGAPPDNSPDSSDGFVLVYESEADGFSGPQILTSGEGPTPSGFGCQVAIDGNRIAVGDPLADAEAGAVELFVRTSTGWAHETRLKPTNSEQDEWFGFGVQLAGDRLVVGAPRERGELGGVNNFGDQTLDGDRRPGAAYLFERSNGAWQQLYYLKDDRPIPNSDFGSGVALSADQVLVGRASSPAVVHVWRRPSARLTEPRPSNTSVTVALRARPQAPAAASPPCCVPGLTREVRVPITTLLRFDLSHFLQANIQAMVVARRTYGSRIRQAIAVSRDGSSRRGSPGRVQHGVRVQPGLRSGSTRQGRRSSSEDQSRSYSARLR